MGRPPGLPKTGGRKAGTSNKKTDELRVILEKDGISIPEKILSLLPKLSAQKQVDTLISLMPYIYPKRKPFEPAGHNELIEPQKLQVVFAKPDGSEEPAFK